MRAQRQCGQPQQAKQRTESKHLRRQTWENPHSRFERPRIESHAFSFLLLLLGMGSLIAMFGVLYKGLNDWHAALQVMANIPLAFIGGVIAIFVTGGTLSVASLVGFISLTGITARNGIMMISHYQHLMKEEGEGFNKQMIIRGSLERLVPVMMTAMTAALSLIPLAIAAGAQGKEILQPMAVVILGGLTMSTTLSQVVVPALFYRYGHSVAAKILGRRREELLGGESPAHAPRYDRHEGREPLPETGP